MIQFLGTSTVTERLIGMMKKTSWFNGLSLWALVALAILRYGVAPCIAEPMDSLKELEQKVVRFELSNGLKVVFFHRDSAPVFSAQIWVKVGGVNEVPGKTGLSHLLEHMAFKGSQSIGTKDFHQEEILLKELYQIQEKLRADRNPSLQEQAETIKGKLNKLWVSDEFSRVYQRQGGSGLNAGTSKDYTFYTVKLPSVAFELWCQLESDRLTNPVFRQFYEEVDVVKEERRMRVEDSPTGSLYEALLSTAYWSHPNRLPVVGWMKDLDNLRVEDLAALHKTYYRPDNMVLALVGDLQEQEARIMLEKYFGPIPKGVGEVPKVLSVEQKQQGERTSVVEYDAQPEIMIGFHKPVYPDADDARFAVVHAILAGGRSSMLERKLVEETQLALAVDTGEAPGQLYPSLFYVHAVPSPGVSVDRLKDAVVSVLDGLKTTPVTEAELTAAKRRVRVEFLSTLTSLYGLSKMLAEAELFWGDWRSLVEIYKTVEDTSIEDVSRLAATYFKRDNRTYVYLASPDHAAQK